MNDDGEHVWPAGFVLDSAKVVQYLLAVEHPDGRTKAKFFISRGFRPDRPEILIEALLKHVIPASHFKRTLPTLYGVKFVFEGALTCPDGSIPAVRTVWMIGEGRPQASFVTAVPIGRAT